jgi:ATP-binding cassette subfamily C protein LapB
MVIHLLSMTFIINLTALLVPLFVMMVYDKVIGARSSDTLPHLLWGAAILVSTDLGLRALRARLLGVMAGRLDYLIGVETFRHLIFLPPLYTERSTVAAQLSRLRQFDSVRDFFTGPNAAIALELPFAGLFIAVIAVLAGYIALIPLAMLLASALFGLLWLPGLRSKALRAGTARNDRQRVLMQSLWGRNEIKAIGGESVWWERFRETSGEAVMANYRTLVANGIMTSVAQGLTTLAGVAVVGLGTLAVMDGGMTIGALIATMALVWRVLSPLQSAFLSLSKLEQMAKAVQQINQLMRLKVERQGGQSGLMLSKLTGGITVDRVSFRNGPDQDPAVLGMSFDVQPGEMMAITGHTGSGKSTLLKLVAGMYCPQAGALLIDGLDIRQLNAMDLRRTVAYVPKETRLYHGTIAQNMRLNNGMATDHQLRKAAREAGVLDEILALPQRFDTWTGDNATSHLPPRFLRALSMARAFVNPPRILLLDEPGGLPGSRQRPTPHGTDQAPARSSHHHYGQPPPQPRPAGGQGGDAESGFGSSGRWIRRSRTCWRAHHERRPSRAHPLGWRRPAPRPSPLPRPGDPARGGRILRHCRGLRLRHRPAAGGGHHLGRDHRGKRGGGDPRGGSGRGPDP